MRNHKVLYLALWLPQGQDWELKQLLFLSDHYHIWTPLVLDFLTARVLSPELSGPSAEMMWTIRGLLSNYLPESTSEYGREGLFHICIVILHM